METKLPEKANDGREAAAEDETVDDNGVTEVESLCMNCHDDVRI
jgi:hypothetical protein